MQTFCESTFELRVLVDPIATYRFQQVEGVRTVAIVPGAPVRWCALLPTVAMPDVPFRLLAKAEDRWGNPTAAEPARFRLRPSRPVRGLPDTLEIGGGERAVRVDGLSVDASGDLTIAFEPERSGSGARFRSNAMVVKPSLGRRRYWGDLHGQSEETIGSGSAEEYFSFARELAGLDFAGHQGNDFQITGKFWEHLQRLTRDADEPGRFVAFPGYEWSGNTALGGDRNVLFLSEGSRSTAAATPWSTMPTATPTAPTSPTCSWRCAAGRRCSFRTSAAVTPTCASTTGCSVRWRCTPRGARSSGCSATPWLAVSASASSATATATRAGPAPATRAPPSSALTAG